MLPYTKYTWTGGQLLAILLAEGLLEEKYTNHNTKCKGDRSAYLQESPRKYAGPLAGIVTLAY